MISVYRFVTNPDWVREQQGWLVVTQHPGQLLGSRLPHCVTGVSLWSVAWNTCYADDIPEYVRSELAMATHLRANTDAQKVWFSGNLQRVVISPAIVHEFVECNKPGAIKPPHYDKLEDAVKLLLAGMLCVCICGAE